MKKSIVIIFAVAIIGALGAVAKAHHNDGAPLAAPGSNATSNTTSMNSSSMHHGGSMMTSYKDGTYDGASEDTPYGTVQIAVVVSGSKITDVKFLQMPNDRGHSQEVTAFAEPYLKDETIQKQTSSIQFVSGATTTSEAYQMSLQAALDQAAA